VSFSTRTLRQAEKSIVAHPESPANNHRGNLFQELGGGEGNLLRKDMDVTAKPSWNFLMSLSQFGTLPCRWNAGGKI